MNKNLVGVVLCACVGLVGCAGTSAGTANANAPGQPQSGVTSSNGGGQRALGDIPNVGVTNGVGATTTNVPNSKGASY